MLPKYSNLLEFSLRLSLLQATARPVDIFSWLGKSVAFPRENLQRCKVSLGKSLCVIGKLDVSMAFPKQLNTCVTKSLTTASNLKHYDLW